jgi:hypothetical protein
MLGTPPEVREGRERMMMKIIANIKKIEGECAKICEESTQIWIDLVEDPNMKAIESKLREEYEKAQQDSERITTLPPTKCYEENHSMTWGKPQQTE